MKGTVKWFDEKKGYGFIEREDGGKDVFVHQTSIIMDGYRTLAPGQTVSFHVEDTDKGPQAMQVTPTE